MPPTLVSHLDANTEDGLAPGVVVSQPNVALFLDVAGFTPLTSALQQFGTVGLEELQGALNSFFGLVDQSIDDAGGAVVRYEGDAAIALFPDTTDGIANAITVARKLIVATDDFAALDTVAGLQSIRAKIGIARGQADSIALERDGRVSVVVGGEAIDLAAAAEHYSSPGQIIVAPSILELVEAPDAATQLGDGHVRWPLSATLVPSAPLEASERHDFSASIAARVVHPVLMSRLELGDGVDTDFRIVTIVFVGFEAESTATLERVEQVMARVGAVADAANAEILTVQTGDKGTNTIIAVGAPVAVDDSATRAVTITDALLNDDSITCRIGVSTGTLLAGRLGGDRRAGYTVLGNAVNMGARLMMKAEFGQALVAEDTVGQLADQSSFSPPIDLDVKGRIDPLRVRSLESLSAAPIQSGRATLPLVGRDAELAILDEAWTRAKEGQGGVVHVVGDGGLGKTRLIEEFARSVDAEPFTTVFPRYRRAAGLEALVAVFRPLLGLDAETQPDPAIVRSIVEQAGWDSSRLPYALRLVGAHIDDDDRGDAAATDAEILRALAVDAVRLRASRSPVMLVLDGAEGLDDESRRLLEDTARAAEQLPVLIVSAGRAVESDHDWPRLGTTITLEPLSSTDAQELARLAGADSPEAVVGAVGMSPLAIRLGAESEGAIGDGVDDGQQQLEQLAAAKIDSAGENAAKWLREASVFGDVIDREIAEEVLGVSADRALVGQGLLTTDLDDASFRFASDLLHGVAYESIRPTRRTELHHQAGDALERFFERDPERVSPAAIAHQFANTDDTERQMAAFKRAGQAAADNYSLADAVYWFDQLLPLVEGSERAETALALGQWHVILGNLAEAEAAFKIATEDRNGVRARAMAGLAEVMQIDGRREDAQLVLGEAERLARSRVDVVALASVLLQRVRVDTGERDRASFTRSVAELRELSTQALPELAARADHAMGTRSYQVEGDFRRGRRYLDSAMQAATRLQNPLLLSELHNDLAALHYFGGSLARAADALDDALVHARRIGYRRGAAAIEYNKALTMMEQGEAAACLPSFLGALQALEEVGDISYRSRVLETAAAVLGNLGQLELATSIATGIAEISDDLDDRFVAVDAHFDIGRFRLLAGDLNEAVDSQRRALAIARELAIASKIVAVEILGVRILHASGQTAEALSTLRQLRQSTDGPEEESSLSYEEWRLTKTADAKDSALRDLESLALDRPRARTERRLALIRGEQSLPRQQAPPSRSFLAALARLQSDINRRAPTTSHG